MSMSITIDQARAAWLERQGLSAVQSEPVPGGWIRSMGGADAYLALRARRPGITREQVDGDLADGVLRVHPGVRNCIWLMARERVGLALVVSDAQHRKRSLREMAKLGVEPSELASLAEAVVHALESGARSPEALRDALPEGAARSLGAAGKKVGHNTTLPVTLRLLEADGRVRRHQATGRLDSQKLVWSLCAVPAVDIGPTPQGVSDQAEALLRHFLAWAGPATVGEYISWTSLGKRVTQAAFAAVGPVEVRIEGVAEPAYVLQEHAEALAQPAAFDGRVRCLTGQDNLLSLRASSALLADPAQHGRELLGMRGRPVALGQVKWFMQRPLIYRGRLVGLWEWDRDAAQAVFGFFADEGAEARGAAVDEVAAVGAFIAQQLGGEARSNSIDGAASQKRKVDYVRAM